MAKRLTEFSPGAGCGCKISPKDLEEILKSSSAKGNFPELLVGYETKDDAAVYQVRPDLGIVSTTDFFTPIVDSPYDFGRIAATNAISDVYAMGGKPLMAIGILGLPIKELSLAVAKEIVEGAREVCRLAGIPLAGGHSIDIPVPIFGLAVTGSVDPLHLKKNSGARPGDRLYLTKPLGVGILTTAEKRQKVLPEHQDAALKLMTTLNSLGEELGSFPSIHAMTDVTGFGLLGHLLEMCSGSGLQCVLDVAHVPRLSGLETYVEEGIFPGGTRRNLDSYGHAVDQTHPQWNKLWPILCDPQTSGGLLLAVDPKGEDELQILLKKRGLELRAFGEFQDGVARISLK